MLSATCKLIHSIAITKLTNDSINMFIVPFYVICIFIIHVRTVTCCITDILIINIIIIMTYGTVIMSQALQMLALFT